MRPIDRRPVRRERLDASANGEHPDVHRPTAESGGDEGLVSVGPIHGYVLEQRQAPPARAITVEEVEQHDAVVGYEHRLGGPALAAQRELDDIALRHGLTAVTHLTALRITFVTTVKGGLTAEHSDIHRRFVVTLGTPLAGDLPGGDRFPGPGDDHGRW